MKPALKSFWPLLLALFLFLFVPAGFAQEEEGEVVGEENARDQILKEYEGTRLGKALEWVLDEDRKYFILPVVSSGPDSGWMVGVAWYHTDLFGKEKRDMVLGAITTQNNQNNLAFFWTEPGRPFEDGRITLSLFYSENPIGGNRYFGETNISSYENVASNYRANHKGAGLGYIYDFTENFNTWTGVSFSTHSFGDPDEDFEFGDDDEASRPISLVHPEIFNSEEFQEGYDDVEIGFRVNYDTRSRERLLREGGGFRVSASTSLSSEMIGADYNFGKVEVTAAHYIPLTDSGKHIFAYRGSFEHSWGETPFDKVPAISSSTNRGYYSGRFRGDNKLEGNIEYRWYAFKYLGFAVFADSGKVFDNGEDGDDALFTDYHPAYGGGLRFRIPPEIIFRIDYGVSHEQSNMYFTLGESF